MFHVAGQYSGGAAADEAYTWTQTQQTVVLRSPLAGSATSAVKCDFAARRLALRVGDGEGSARVDGELSAVIVVDDSLWVVEDDAVVVTMRKAVPGLWSRLLASDEEPAEAPKLLDGQERAAPQSKEQLLKQAKERAKTELADGPSRAKPHIVEGLTGATLSLERDAMPELPVLMVRNCTACEVTLPSGALAIKVQLEGCERCTFVLDGRVLTETVEVWDCAGCTVRFNAKTATVQVDKCRELTLAYAQAGFFDRLMHTGARTVRLTFADAPALATTLELDELQKAHPTITLDEATDQFITRRLSDASGALTTELVVRLCNDFPTTDREVRDFGERTRVHADKLDEVVEGMLGSSLGKNLTDAEREQMKTMMREQSEAASAAQATAEQTAEGRHAARVDFKKKEGNARFKEANYQQAAVLYTEAISLDDSQHALYSNRAACFLKLGRYAQAREDAEACVRLAPEFAKGHFRLALALQAEDKFPEACAAFTKTLNLEPNNKEAQAGLNMARMQAERSRRQQAGELNH